LKKVLFISHDASLTGAPIVLLHFLEWASKSSKLSCDVLLLHGGPLQERFEQSSKRVFTLNKKGNKFDFLSRVSRKVLRKIFPVNHQYIIDKLLLKKLIKQNYSLIYANTVVSSKVGVYLKEHLSLNLICHVHEMNYFIDSFFSDFYRPDIYNKINHFVFVSLLSRNQILDRINIPESNYSMINEFINVNLLNKTSVKKEKIIDDLNLQGKFIVGGSGSFTWRKGGDLFIQISRLVKSIDPFCEIHFLWVGSVSGDIEVGYDYENSLLNHESNLTFIPSTSFPQDYFQLFDLFLLTSREDPFPLVCIEAASLAKPILCFENATGIVEMLPNKTDSILPFLDTQSMAYKIIDLYYDRLQLKKMSEDIYEVSTKYDVSIAGPKISEIIYSLSI
jgi:glycosyltransferase involved in cell wall biosynthesis